jgi:hypothetical protein
MRRIRTLRRHHALLHVRRRPLLAQAGRAGLRRLLLARQAGMIDQYNDYIKSTAEKIDEDARKAGVFEEVVTVTPSQMGTSAAITDGRTAHLQAEESRAAPRRSARASTSTRASSPTRTSASATASDRPRSRLRSPGNLDRIASEESDHHESTRRDTLAPS